MRDETETGTSPVPPSKGDITLLLERMGHDPAAAEAVFALVADELRRIANERLAGEYHAQSVPPTSLMHEAFMKLLARSDVHWRRRAAYFAGVKREMTRILIDRARRRNALRRHGRQLPLDHAMAQMGSDNAKLGDAEIAGPDALRKLERISPRLAEVFYLYVAVRLSKEQIGSLLGVSTRWVTAALRRAAQILGHDAEDERP